MKTLLWLWIGKYTHLIEIFTLRIVIACMRQRLQYHKTGQASLKGHLARVNGMGKEIKMTVKKRNRIKTNKSRI